MLINRFLKKISRWLQLRSYRKHMVGRYFITLPPGHPLDIFQEEFKNYDKKLPKLAAILSEKYKLSMSIVDIGANIGDTAVAMSDATSCPILCVEGNPYFLPILMKNIKEVSSEIRVINKFIGPKSTKGARVVTKDGTAHILRDVHNDTEIDKYATASMITYNKVISSNQDLPQVKLIKIDTDGFDFKIILDVFSDFKGDLPVLFFEYDPGFSPKPKINEAHEAHEATNALILAGYRYFIFYDNFGNYMRSFFSQSPQKEFIDAFTYLASTRDSGGGINYMDVCCFSEKDKDVFIRSVALEMDVKL